MIDLKTIVKVPPKSKIQGGYVYFVTKTEYVPAKKYNIDTRVSIGSLCGGSRTEMHPNDNYRRLFGAEPEKVPPGRFSATVKCGACIALLAIARESGVWELLGKAFGNDDAAIMNLACYSVITEGFKAQHYEAFERDHMVVPCPPMSDYDISRIFRDAVTEKAAYEFMKGWCEAWAGGGDLVWISYDGSNEPCVAEGVELAEYGHAKSDPTDTQVNFSIGSDLEARVPLFYEAYHGSINDVKQARKMLEFANALGYRKAGVILDRGYLSKANLDAIRSMMWGFMIMAKSNLRSVRNAIKSARPRLESPSSWLPEHEVFAATLTSKIFKSDEKASFFHVFLSKAVRDQRRADLLAEFASERRELESLVGKSRQEAERRGEWRFFKPKYAAGEGGEETLAGFSERRSAFENAVAETGFFVIITSMEMTAERALALYRGRDGASEKGFSGVKSHLGGDAFGVQTTECVRGKGFVLFIAGILRSLLGIRTRPLYKKDRKSFTVVASIKALDQIEATKYEERYVNRYTMTKTQERLLSAVGLDAEKVDEMIGAWEPFSYKTE